MTQHFKVKLAAISKDEGFYLPLWVYHHLYFGFDTLDIRINNNTDNSIPILEHLKSVYGDRLHYSFADQELAESRQQDINFQTYIYKKILDESLKQDFTHLIFLDIDEYWCPSNFKDTIKDFLAGMPDFDVCMFQWFMEVPNPSLNIDDFTFVTDLALHKNAHVKSLANLKAPIATVRAHNHIVPKGRYLLSNQTVVNFSETDQNRGTVPEELYEANRLHLDEYFIYHNIFRSQDEYISSLLRGNKIDGEDSLLKANRFGFLPTSPEAFNLYWKVDAHVLEAYQHGYTQLITSFQSELELARKLVLDRKATVLAYLKDDHFLQQINANKMFGVSPDIYQVKKNNYFLKSKVDNLKFNAQTLVCSFDCEVSSEITNYELVLTDSTSKTPLAATIALLSEGQLGHRWVRTYHCVIPISELSGLVYKRQPPFCLAAYLTETDEWLLVERGKFREIAPALIPHATRFRKKQRDQALKLAVTDVQTAEPPVPFWRKWLSKVLGT